MKITKPIKLAIKQKHPIYWKFWPSEGYILECETGFHENGRRITRKLNTYTYAQAQDMTDILKPHDVDLSKSLRAAREKALSADMWM